MSKIKSRLEDHYFVDNKNFRQLIDHYRENHNLSIKQIAEMSKMGRARLRNIFDGRTTKIERYEIEALFAVEEKVKNEEHLIEIGTGKSAGTKRLKPAEASTKFMPLDRSALAQLINHYKRNL